MEELPDVTQEFRLPSPEDMETREFHEDIMRMVDRLNRESINIMGADGFARIGMKVKSLDRVPEDGSVRWYITLFNPEHPDSEQDTIRMTLGDFQKQRYVEVVER